jgi:hypothetical protein
MGPGKITEPGRNVHRIAKTIAVHNDNFTRSNPNADRQSLRWRLLHQAFLMRTLHFNHGVDCNRSIWKNRENTVPQRLDNPAPAGLKQAADPARQLGYGLGCLGIAQGFEGRRAASQICKYNGCADTHLLDF